MFSSELSGLKRRAPGAPEWMDQELASHGSCPLSSSSSAVLPDGSSSSVASMPLTFEDLCRKRKDGGLVGNTDHRIVNQKPDKVGIYMKEIKRDIAVALHLAKNSSLKILPMGKTRLKATDGTTVSELFNRASLALQLPLNNNLGGKTTTLTNLAKEIQADPALLAVQTPGAAPIATYSYDLPFSHSLPLCMPTADFMCSVNDEEWTLVDLPEMQPSGTSASADETQRLFESEYLASLVEGAFFPGIPPLPHLCRALH